jgi:hypothetical protein
MKKMMMVAATATLMSSAAIAQSWNNGSWTPTPVSQEYPACSGTDSEDRCIQLYERGVRTASNLALNRDMSQQMASAVSGSTSLSMDDPAYTGQGGPYEPVDPASLAASSMPTPTSRSGYPACPRSDAADNCIQLYERGVTGSGN